MNATRKEDNEAWRAHAEHTGIKRIASAARFSAAGITEAWRNEKSFRLELALTFVLTPLAFWVGTTAAERCLLIGSCLILLITELLNTAVETATDRVSFEHHELSRLAKDLGSAAVFIAVLLVGLVWILIGAERFI